MKRLIAYFSASGRTKEVAYQLARYLKADIYEIKPKEKYTKEDLDWMNQSSRSSIEMKDKSSRPEIIKDDLDVSQYDEIFLGFPIWWYTAPTIINTFLESYDFDDKDIIIWATSGSSGLCNSKSDLSKSTYANIKEGRILNKSKDIDIFLDQFI